MKKTFFSILIIALVAIPLIVSASGFMTHEISIEIGQFLFLEELPLDEDSIINDLPEELNDNYETDKDNEIDENVFEEKQNDIQYNN